jgi:hypothetical protein
LRESRTRSTLGDKAKAAATDGKAKAAATDGKATVRKIAVASAR